mgnify:CR=1 FL=1
MNLDNNILLITKEFPKIAPGGRELLNKFNHDVLSSIFAEKLKVLFLNPNIKWLRAISREWETVIIVTGITAQRILKNYLK